MTSFAFLRYCDKFLQKLRTASKCANIIENPKSWVLVSKGTMHVLTSDDCGIVWSEIFRKGFENVLNLVRSVNIPKTSSTVRSFIKRYGSKWGIVVLGAWGFEQSFMLFKVGRSLASKLKALSVYFCLNVCQVVSSFWI